MVIIDGLCWESKTIAFIIKDTFHFKVDGLMGVHVVEIIIGIDIVNNFKIQAVGVVFNKMGSVKCDIGHFVMMCSIRPGISFNCSAFKS